MAETFDEYKTRMHDEQQQFHQERREEFTAWEQERVEKMAAFHAKITNRWGEVAENTEKVWVEYDSSGNSVSAVDFETGTVTVEVLVDQTVSAESLLVVALERVLSSSGNSGFTPVEGDGNAVASAPLLSGQIDIDTSAIDCYISEIAKEQTTQSGLIKLVVELPLVPDHLQKRLRPYLPLVRRYCHDNSVEIAHTLATIHTESYFNPMARSHVGAIGLMQLMPQYGGREAYRLVKGNDRTPSEQYLYDPEQNIELGTAYIRILENRYLGDITDPVSRRYCAVAGYNTGPGNVAKAFTGNNSIRSAIPIINSMSSDRVYRTLIRDLPYEETRDYLQKVEERRELYLSVE